MHVSKLFPMVSPFCQKGGGGEGRFTLERILFVLLKIGSKLKLFLMRPLRAKYGKICQRTKEIKDALVYAVKQAHFSKIAQRKQKFIKYVNCVFI